MTPKPQLRRRIAILLQMALGAALIAIAVSTQFKFDNPSSVELHVFEGITANFVLPGLVVMAIKGALAFLGSYLLMRKDLILPPKE